jgi:F420H(2)-dependent quinone reductase
MHWGAEAMTMQTETKEPAVRSFEPTAGFHTLTTIANVAMRPLLRSRIGSRMHELALLSFTGRRSGTRYTVPVAYHEVDGEGIVLTASGWRVNLRGGADVDLVHDGVTRPMRAQLVEDPDEVARIYGRLLRQVGIKRSATKVGLKVLVDRMPTDEEIREATVAGNRAVVRLTPR